MARFAEAEFISRGGTSAAIADAVSAFVRASNEWRFLQAESADYAQDVEGPALIAESVMQGEYAGIAVAIGEPHDKRGRLRIFNVVPRDGQLTVDQYNGAVRKFVLGFRRFSKGRQLQISASIRVPREPTKLHEVIPGARTRRLFERFLAPGLIWGTPTTSHPNDIERLDIFICAVHRFGASIHLPALNRWLIQEKRWPAKDADWTCNRIEIGTEILAVNGRF
jgi:hypothetical protein